MLGHYNTQGPGNHTVTCSCGFCFQNLHKWDVLCCTKQSTEHPSLGPAKLTASQYVSCEMSKLYRNTQPNHSYSSTVTPPPSHLHCTTMPSVIADQSHYLKYPHYTLKVGHLQIKWRAKRGNCIPKEHMIDYSHTTTHYGL